MTKRLLSEGHSVVGIDNLNDYYPAELKLSRLGMLGIDRYDIEGFLPVRADRFTFIKSDINNAELFTVLLRDQEFDAVCHLAAQAGVRYSIEHPEKYVDTNLKGFFNVLEFCRSHPNAKLVYASSSSVYGKNSSVPYKEYDVTDSPVSLYAATKKSNELMAYSYSELYGFESVGLRFFTVYGPWGRPDMAPYLFTKAIIEEQTINVFNNGEMFRDFTYIDDIIEGVCRVTVDAPAKEEARKTKSRVYNIGNSRPVNIEEFIGLIENISGREARKNYMPMQPGDVKATWADTTRLKEDYGYSPSTTLDRGLLSYVQWFMEYYYRKGMNQTSELSRPRIH